MTTPICDFVRRYAKQNALRLHMPGHKGTGILGIEAQDITEIEGADSLFEANGIIRESERNASLLFGADTYYSAEGSSQAIRAMLALAVRYAKANRKKPIIAAARNAHKVFLSAAALLDFKINWLPITEQDSYLSCKPTKESLTAFLQNCEELPTALYVTSPDYLGNTADLAALAEVCHKFGVLLLVDNAHGAYLKFLSPSRHPIDLGADACADSAHKTLSALTGAAYLHVSPHAPIGFGNGVKEALALFSSTSPSYLILQSLDALNKTLAQGYADKLSDFIRFANQKKSLLEERGWQFCGDEPLKWTILAKACGYTGQELAQALSKENIVCEFADTDHLVLMLTPSLGEDGTDRLYRVLSSLPIYPALSECPPKPTAHRAVCSVREAMLSPAEELPVEKAIGRILASPSVACPPAVPILVCGEIIDNTALEAFCYYGIKTCTVVKD
ncbi:MAG: aminotransferase class V-fold PLP-dependent enzyme [Clostridia bacterium]|nr:aminotransferase class V-fold PLP-dependent enzyme [Clostridia bacterium]